MERLDYVAGDQSPAFVGDAESQPCEMRKFARAFD
jgi:hypothetical protein